MKKTQYLALMAWTRQTPRRRQRAAPKEKKSNRNKAAFRPRTRKNNRKTSVRREVYPDGAPAKDNYFGG